MDIKDLVEIIQAQNNAIIALRQEMKNTRRVQEDMDEELDFIARAIQQIVEERNK